MSQNLLIAPQADGTGRRSRCPLRCAYVGFRFVRYHGSPWWVLTIAPLKLLFAAREERTHVWIRWFNAIARINFVRVYRLLDDLLW